MKSYLLRSAGKCMVTMLKVTHKDTRTTYVIAFVLISLLFTFDVNLSQHFRCKFITATSTLKSTLRLKKIVFMCFNESPLKIMKNVFYFILKAIFVLQIFSFFS